MEKIRTSKNLYENISNLIYKIHINLTTFKRIHLIKLFKLFFLKREIDLREYSQVFENRLVINNLKIEDSGDYECYLQDGRSNLVRLYVKESTKNQPDIADASDEEKRRNQEEELRRRQEEEFKRRKDEEHRRRQQEENQRNHQNENESTSNSNKGRNESGFRSE